MPGTNSQHFHIGLEAASELCRHFNTTAIPRKKCLEPLLKVCRQDPRDPLGAGLALVSSSARITVDNGFELGFHGLRCDTPAVTAKLGTKKLIRVVVMGTVLVQATDHKSQQVG